MSMKKKVCMIRNENFSCFPFGFAIITYLFTQCFLLRQGFVDGEEWEWKDFYEVDYICQLYRYGSASLHIAES